MQMNIVYINARYHSSVTIRCIWDEFVKILCSANPVQDAVLAVHCIKKTKTQCQDEFRSLSGSVTEILTACRMLQSSTAWCQNEAEIRGFPTMYIMRGGKYGQNWRKT